MHARYALKQPTLEAPVRHIVARQHPGGGALKHRQVRGQRRYLGHDLHRAGTGAHHGHPLAGQIQVGTPLVGVKGHAGKSVQARHLGNQRLVQRAGGQHHMARQHGRLARQFHLPVLLLGQPAQGLHLGVERNERTQLVLVHQAQDVVLNFLLLRVGPAPGVIGLKRQRIQVRGHIAGAAGIHVVAPGAAHLRASLQNQHRGMAGLSQLNSGAQAAQPCANDCYFNHFGHFDFFHAGTVAQ